MFLRFRMISAAWGKWARAARDPKKKQGTVRSDGTPSSLRVLVPTKWQASAPSLVPTTRLLTSCCFQGSWFAIQWRKPWSRRVSVCNRPGPDSQIAPLPRRRHPAVRFMQRVHPQTIFGSEIWWDTFQRCPGPISFIVSCMLIFHHNSS
jgi:hypothetical protein